MNKLKAALIRALGGAPATSRGGFPISRVATPKQVLMQRAHAHDESADYATEQAEECRSRAAEHEAEAAALRTAAADLRAAAALLP